MRRREFLLTRCPAFLLGIATLFGGCSTPARRPDAANALTRDVATLRARDYSEVGVNMLLTGENLGTGVTHAEDLGGRRLSQVLANYAERWTSGRSDLPEDDVAALVELLAKRDFDAGGSGFS